MRSNRSPRGVALVTGATGLIGGEIAAGLAMEGWRVHAVVRAKGGISPPERLHHRLSQSGRARLMDGFRIVAVHGDLTGNLELPKDVLREILLIVHCAGETSFRDGAPCRQVNTGSALRLRELAHEMSATPRILFVSSAAVCMDPRHGEAHESFRFSGYSNPYTTSKREAESLLLGSGLDVVVIRPSIVLCRGVENRRMVRSLLWVLPVMKLMGEVPVEADARLDAVPSDYVARAVCGLAGKQQLHHRCYHISTGASSAVTMSEVCEVLRRTDPSFAGIKLIGEGAPLRPQTKSTLAARIEPYLPFINADVVYSNSRLQQEMEDKLPLPPKATTYLSELMARISLREALAASFDP